MPDDLKDRIKSIKKKMDDDYKKITEQPMSKISSTRQKELFNGFITGLEMEIEKDEVSGAYLSDILKSFKNTKLTVIRFAVEKSFDRYSRVIELMKKYDENFDEEDILKYQTRYNILNKILSFMVSNNVGDFLFKADGDSDDGF